MAVLPNDTQINCLVDVLETAAEQLARIAGAVTFVATGEERRRHTLCLRLNASLTHLDEAIKELHQVRASVTSQEANPHPTPSLIVLQRAAAAVTFPVGPQ